MRPIDSVEINIKKSAIFNYSCEMKNADGTPMDLTGKVITSQLREKAESPEAIDFTVTVTGSIVSLSLTAVQTSQITYKAGVYDIFADDLCLWEGTANIYTDVTRQAWMQMGVPMNIILMASREDFPETGMAALLYIAADTNRMYRYADDSYVMIGGGGTNEAGN